MPVPETRICAFRAEEALVANRFALKKEKGVFVLFSID
jgi:hypothetical protein